MRLRRHRRRALRSAFWALCFLLPCLAYLPADLFGLLKEPAMSRAFVTENAAQGAGHWTKAEAERKAKVEASDDPDYAYEVIPTGKGYRIAKKDNNNFVAWVSE